MSNLEPKPWHCCLDCQDTDFGGWPAGGELPIKILTNELRHAMLEKCTRLSNPNLPSEIPWENQKTEEGGATNEGAAAARLVRYLCATEVTERVCHNNKECGLHAGVELDCAKGIHYHSCFDCLGEIPNAPEHIFLPSNERAHMLDYCTRKDEISFPESLSFGPAEEELREALVRYPMKEREDYSLAMDKAPCFLTEPPPGMKLPAMSEGDVATDEELKEAGRVKKLTPSERVARRWAGEGFIPKTDDRSTQEKSLCAIHAAENTSKNKGKSRSKNKGKNCIIPVGTFSVLPDDDYENGLPDNKDYYKKNPHVQCAICFGNVNAASRKTGADFDSFQLKRHAPACLELQRTDKLTNGKCGCGLGVHQFKKNHAFTKHAKICTGNTCPKCNEPYDVQVTGEMNVESVTNALYARKNHRKACQI